MSIKIYDYKIVTAYTPSELEKKVKEVMSLNKGWEPWGNVVTSPDLSHVRRHLMSQTMVKAVRKTSS